MIAHPAGNGNKQRQWSVISGQWSAASGYFTIPRSAISLSTWGRLWMIPMPTTIPQIINELLPSNNMESVSQQQH